MHTIPVSNLCAAAVLGFSAMLSSGPVFARDYAVAVPRVVAPEDARSIYNSVIDLVMTVAGGDTVHVVDATVGETIATFTVPNDGSEVVAANRARAVAEPKAAWGRFVRDHYMADGIDSSSVGAIDLPDTLTALSQAYAHLDPAARTVCALVIGVPLHQDQREPAFDMTPGPLVPSDGLIVAATSMSPYGTADLRGDMQGMRVAFWTLDPPDGWHSDLHEQRVERAWSLYVAARGGVMSAYGPDAATVLQRFEACEAEPVRSFVWDDTRRTPAMLDLRRTMQTQEIEVLIEKEVLADNDPVSVNPDDSGRFGRVIRLERVAFLENSGLIQFDEVRRGTVNPRYEADSRAAGDTGVAVAFSGYFAGQRLGTSSECPSGASPDGCVMGSPIAPLQLSSNAPTTFTANDRSNPESPALSGSPLFSGPVSIFFHKDVAAVGLVGGSFNNVGSTAIQAFDREGGLIGGVVNTTHGMEFLALATEDGMPRIAGVQFSLIGREAAGYAVDTIRFALPGQYRITGSEN